MHTVSIDLSFRYEGNLSPAEKHPQIRCYLDARFNREPVTIQLEKEKQKYKTTVKGELSKTNAVVPPTAALCFASMAWRNNEFGSPCLLDTGVSHVTLGEIIQSDLPFRKTMEMTMNTAQGLCKGKLEIEIHSIQGIHRMDNRSLRDPVTIDAHVVPLITDYINNTMEMEQEMPETFEGTSNMRIPYDYSESGIQTTLGTPLPAVAFVMSETPKSNERYWENAFETIMKRDELKPTDWNRLNDIGKARTTILTICYAAQYMDYVGDTVDRNTRFSEYNKQLVQPYENFGDALAMNSGDCEDLAGVELQCYNAFVSFPKFKDPALQEMQKIARNYVPPLSLDVVRGAQVSDQVAHYGAHMNDNFIPIRDFEKWMENSREGRQFTKTLPPIQDRMNVDLPFLVGEGTGMYEPYGYDNPLAPIMSYVYGHAQSLEFAKKPILHKKGEPGSFFVGSLVGLTDYFYRRGATTPMSFWYCTKQANGTLSRGASYADMMNGSDRVALKVQPDPGKRIMATVEEAILKRVPPNSLILSETRHEQRKEHHSVLERVCKSVQSLNRPAGPKHQKVPVYIRPHQLNTVIGNQMIADFQRMNRVWKVEYELEEITDKLWGYRMEIYVK